MQIRFLGLAMADYPALGGIGMFRRAIGHRRFGSCGHWNRKIRGNEFRVATRSIVVAVVLILASQLAAHAAVKLSIGSDAKTPAERKSEGAELAKAVKELSKSSATFQQVYGLVRDRVSADQSKKDVVIRIVYGDSTKHTKEAGSGGTFVPEWNNPTAPVGQRGFKGGTLIVDKKRLQALRPGHDYKDFLAEVITHELYHAYEDCREYKDSAGHAYHNESYARSFGEKAAKELKYATLDETHTVPKPKTAGSEKPTQQKTNPNSSRNKTAAAGGYKELDRAIYYMFGGFSLGKEFYNSIEKRQRDTKRDFAMSDIRLAALDARDALHKGQPKQFYAALAKLEKFSHAKDVGAGVRTAAQDALDGLPWKFVRGWAYSREDGTWASDPSPFIQLMLMREGDSVRNAGGDSGGGND